jgi:hemolysin D
VEGAVINVSGDATPDGRLGLVYAAGVRLERSTMQVDERVVNLSPGMAVTAEVKLGDRRIIEYLMSPLLRYRDESIRER